MLNTDWDKGGRMRAPRVLVIALAVMLAIGITAAIASGASIRSLAAVFAPGSSKDLADSTQARPATDLASGTTARRRAAATVDTSRRVNPRHHRHHGAPATPVPPASGTPTSPTQPTTPTTPTTPTVPTTPTTPEPPAPTEPSAPADASPPQTSIESNPADETSSTFAGFTFSSSEADSGFQCKLDNRSWVDCTSPRSYSDLAVGAHQFSVQATDAAGNLDATPATVTWTVTVPPPPPPAEDTTPPQTSITGKPPAVTTSTTANFTFAASESGSSFECKLDDGTWGLCKSPLTYLEIEEGEHEFRVRAVDRAENVDSTPASYEWEVETTPTTPPPTEPPPPTSGCTTTVSSTSALTSALSSATPGSVLCLADGSYAKLTLSASKAAPGVTVRAANPAGATIAGASLAGSNLTLARFVITNGVQVMGGASGMTIDHNRITGGGQGIDMPTSSTMVNDTKIIGNKLIGPFGEDAIHLNRYHDANGDGIGVLIEGNEITNVRENGNHSDCLQTVWVGDHIVFRKNYLHDNRCQGFFIKDQDSLGNPAGPVEGITVENNLFVRNQEPCGPPLTSCGQPNYFQVFGPYSGFRMTRNTIWGDSGNSVAALRGGTSPDTVISGNVIYKLWTDTNMTATAVTDNTVCILEAGSGGSWPSSRAGETRSCSLSFQGTATDDYRLVGGGDRGVDWVPAQQQYGP